MRTAHIVALLALAMAACGAPTVAAPHDEVVPTAVVDGVAISIEMLPPGRGGALVLTYQVGLAGAPLPDIVEFSFPDRWGGRDGFFDDIDQISAAGADGQSLAIEVREPGRIGVATDGTPVLTLTYRVAPARRRLHESGRFRALLTADTFYAPGHAVYAQPLSLGSEPLQRISVRANTAGAWPIYATHPLDGTPIAIEALVDGAVFAGNYDHVTRDDGRRLVDLYVAPGATSEPARLVARIHQVVVAQSALLGPSIARRTTVVALRRDDAPDRITGNGRAGGFVLELGTAVDVEDDALLALIAHENLHRLIGHTLRFAAADEYASLWFREGVTDYLAVRTAVAGDVVEPTRFFAMIGDAITNYRSNPIAASVDAAGLASRYGSDRDYRRLPYDKGALLGMLIDLELRRRDAGDLVGFVAFLRDDSASRALPLSNAALHDALGRYSGFSWDDFWMRWVLGSDWLPIFDTLARSGIDVVERLVPAPYYGFRTNVTSEGAWFVSEVAAGSPAAQAGLRAGQPLASEPIVPDDRSGRPIEVLVLVSGRTTAVRVVPATGQQRAFVLVEDSDPQTDFMAAFGL